MDSGNFDFEWGKLERSLENAVESVKDLDALVKHADSIVVEEFDTKFIRSTLFFLLSLIRFFRSLFKERCWLAAFYKVIRLFL